MSYVGPAEIHDAMVQRVMQSGTRVTVHFRGYEGQRVVVRFSGVVSVRREQAEGMIVYSLSELTPGREERRFVFVDARDGEDGVPNRALEIVAGGVAFAVESEA